jgi:hypothetical protein
MCSAQTRRGPPCLFRRRRCLRRAVRRYPGRRRCAPSRRTSSYRSGWTSFQPSASRQPHLQRVSLAHTLQAAAGDQPCSEQVTQSTRPARSQGRRRGRPGAATTARPVVRSTGTGRHWSPQRCGQPSGESPKAPACRRRSDPAGRRRVPSFRCPGKWSSRSRRPQEDGRQQAGGDPEQEVHWCSLHFVDSVRTGLGQCGDGARVGWVVIRCWSPGCGSAARSGSGSWRSRRR